MICLYPFRIAALVEFLKTLVREGFYHFASVARCATLSSRITPRISGKIASAAQRFCPTACACYAASRHIDTVVPTVYRNGLEKVNQVNRYLLLNQSRKVNFIKRRVFRNGFNQGRWRTHWNNSYKIFLIGLELNYSRRWTGPPVCSPS